MKRMTYFLGLGIALAVAAYSASTEFVPQRRNPRPPNLAAVHVNFEFQVVESVKVRQRHLPQKFDDKGKPTKYTAQELKELKGPNSKLPGYTAELGDLKPGQLLTIELHQKKLPKSAPKVSDSLSDIEKKLKPKWTFVERITGKLNKVSEPGKDGKKAVAKKGTDKKAEEEPLKITVQIDTVGISGKGIPKKGEVSKDIYATTIIIEDEAKASK
jgi:hypothetical protein